MVTATGRREKATGSRRREGRLLERDGYLEQVAALFAEDWDRPVGPIVVEGRTGTGKTAFLNSACQIARDAGWTVLHARGDGLRTRAPFGVCSQLLASLGHATPDNPSEHGQARAVADDLDQLVKKLASTTGVVIAVDDAQWSDDESSGWLYAFQRRGYKRARLIFGLAARSPGSLLRPVEKILTKASARLMTLGPLSEESVAAIASEYFGVTADESFVRACYDETQGYPSLVFPLFRELKLKHVAPEASGVAHVRSITSSAVARSVLGRLEALDADAASVLEMVAIGGNAVDVEIVSEVTGIEAEKVRTAAQSLTAVDLLAGGRKLSVSHPFVRRTVYEEIAPARRAELHVRTAKILKARHAPLVELADHLAAAEPSGDEWVAGQLEEAGLIALRLGDGVRAVRYLLRALAEQSRETQSPDILLSLARAEADVDVASAVKHLREALERGAEPLPAAEAALDVTRRCQPDDGRPSLGPLLTKIATLLPEEERSTKAELLVAAVLVSRSPAHTNDAARALRVSVARSGEQRTTSEKEALALCAALDSGRAATPPAQIAAAVRSAVLGEELAHRDSLKCELWARAVLALARTGEFEEADRLARHAQESAQSRDLPVADAEFSTSLAISLALQGSLSAAEAQARRALAAVADHPQWSRRQEAAACLVDVLVDQGRSEEADEIVLGFDLDVPPSCLDGHPLREQRGRIRATQGRWTESVADLLSAGRRADESGIDSPIVTCWRSESALALSAEGHESEAIRRAAENLERARANNTPWVIGAALRVVGLVGEDDKRLSRLEEAVDLLEGSPAQLQLAGALIDLGQTLRETGAQPARSRTALRRGADLAFRTGAAPLLARAAVELRLSGARPRRLALSGADALTSSERKVVTLAVRGSTNAEIARELFLAEKTVEGHLLRAYRKLNVRTRRDLQAMYKGNAADSSEHSPTSHGPR